MAELIVVDTSILIDHERGNAAASAYVSGLLRRNAAALHPVTRAELVFGARSRSLDPYRRHAHAVPVGRRKKR